MAGTTVKPGNSFPKMPGTKFGGKNPVKQAKKIGKAGKAKSGKK